MSKSDSNHLIGPQKYFSEQLDKFKPGHPEHQKMMELSKDLELIRQELHKSKASTIPRIRHSTLPKKLVASRDMVEMIDLTDDSLESSDSEGDCEEIMDQLVAYL
ncbi:hypothetical protein I203_107954 [Kwoniella mangroviensis CBS 8507]|uniref:hypothetical protein n=1 Tax=Kwoniella mangroviensis CBS 8507 TaxID=1296122 RepID=UPI003063BB69